jgi:hypothetical protein
MNRIWWPSCFETESRRIMSVRGKRRCRGGVYGMSGGDGRA